MSQIVGYVPQFWTRVNAYCDMLHPLLTSYPKESLLSLWKPGSLLKNNVISVSWHQDEESPKLLGCSTCQTYLRWKWVVVGIYMIRLGTMKHRFEDVIFGLTISQMMNVFTNKTIWFFIGLHPIENVVT